MKKILKYCALCTIALVAVLSFSGSVRAASGECTEENGCRTGERGPIYVSGQYGNYGSLSQATPNTRNKVKANYWAATADKPYLPYLHPYEQIGVTVYYNGKKTDTYGYNIYYDAYSALYCLDGNLEGDASLNAERFLISSTYTARVQAHDYAIMSILTSGGNSTDPASYFAKLTAIRAVTITFGLDKTSAGGSSVNTQYAVYGLINKWLKESDSDYNTIASKVTVRSKGEFSARSGYYFEGSPVESAKAYYLEALSVAAEYLTTGSSSVNFKEETADPSDREVISDATGQLVSMDVYHEFTIGGFDKEDENASFTIDGIEFEKQYTGLLKYGISKIEIDGTVVAENFENFGQNFIDLFPSIDFSKELNLVVTVHLEGYEYVDEGSSTVMLDCEEQPIKYTLKGKYNSSQSGAFSGYVATIWYSGVANMQRFVGIEEGSSTEQVWESPKEVVMVEECGECALLLKACEAGDKDACEEYEEKCDFSCLTTVDTFECCNELDEVIVSTLDDHEVNIKGPSNSVVCFVENIDKQKSTSTGYENIVGTSDDEGNTYKLMSNKYCAVSCKEDYAMTMPTAKLVNAGRYFTFKARVEGTKTCYTNTIDIEQYNKDIITKQKELLSAYNTYRKWYELYYNGTIVAVPGTYNSSCRCDSHGCGPSCSKSTYYPQWKATATVSDWQTVTREYEETGEIDRSVGANGVSATYTYERTIGAQTYDCPGGEWTTRSCSGTGEDRECETIEHSCSGGSATYYTGTEVVNTEADFRNYLHSQMVSAKSKLEAAKEAYEATIEEFAECTDDTWTSELNYEPDIYYDYEESYIADYYNNHGEMIESIESVTTDSEWLCVGEGSLTNNSYSSCRTGSKGSRTSTLVQRDYVVCTVDGCEIESRYDYNHVSEANYAKKTSTVEASYKPATLFYNVYVSGEIVPTSEGEGRDDTVALENKLPVALNTKRGIYEYTVNISVLGEYYDESCKDGDCELGRLIGGTKAVINRGDYSEMVNSDGSVHYVCNYIVNMGKVTTGDIVCNFDKCDEGNCTNNCVGPNCGDTCYGENCVVDCIGVGCIYDSDAGTSLVEKVVSLNNLFPNGTNSYNWNRDLNEKADATILEIEDKGNNVYDEEPILSVTLTPSAVRAIKEYNDQAENDGGYSNATMDCYELNGYPEIACYSTFITNLIEDNKIEYDNKTIINNLDIVNNRDIILGNRNVSDNNTKYFTYWTGTISEDKMIGPAWK